MPDTQHPPGERGKTARAETETAGRAAEAAGRAAETAGRAAETAGWAAETAEIRRRRHMARQQGGAEAVKRHHAKGRLTIRERIATLADDHSFREIGASAGAASHDEHGNLTGFQPANFILGFATINGRRVIVGGEDFTLKGGSPNPAGLRKSVYAETLAVQYRLPLVRLHEGGGGSVAGTGGKTNPARRSAGGDAVFAPQRFASVAEALGTAPVAAAAMGPVAGLPAARLVASHFCVMCRHAQVLIAGPAVVKRATDETRTKEQLGGADVHARSGVVDNVADTEPDALAQIARFLSYMPGNVWQLPPRGDTHDPADRTDDALTSIVPRDRRKPFAMRRIVRSVADEGSVFEVTRRFGPGIITAFARLDGWPVGILANDCMFYAGAMTAEAAQKTRRFVDTCNTFHLPIISLVDEPGFMIGEAAERAATIRHGVAAIAAVMQSRTPWATVIVHKVFGVAGAAHFGPGGFVLSWPSAITGALPVEGGVAVAFARDIAAAPDPDARRRELEQALAQGQSAFPRAENFSVHEIIDPRETRPRLCEWLSWARPAMATRLGPHATTMRP